MTDDEAMRRAIVADLAGYIRENATLTAERDKLRAALEDIRVCRYCHACPECGDTGEKWGQCNPNCKTAEALKSQ